MLEKKILSAMAIFPMTVMTKTDNGKQLQAFFIKIWWFQDSDFLLMDQFVNIKVWKIAISEGKKVCLHKKIPLVSSFSQFLKGVSSS